MPAKRLEIKGGTCPECGAYYEEESRCPFCRERLVPDYDPTGLTLEISPDGTASTDWWTKEAEQILSALGPPAPGYEEVNSTPWCG